MMKVLSAFEIFEHNLFYEEILKIAIKEKVTFYDAAYIAAAEHYGSLLCSRDRKLIEIAENYVDVIRL